MINNFLMFLFLYNFLKTFCLKKVTSIQLTLNFYLKNRYNKRSKLFNENEPTSYIYFNNVLYILFSEKNVALKNFHPRTWLTKISFSY